jgi:ribose/xylose/arabinose/galactoside ABC-type transport system permease subunit
MRFGIQMLGIGAFYVIVLAVFSTQTSDFLEASNARTILDSAVILGIVALGQTLAIISGGFDLSVGGVVPLGAVTYAMLCAHTNPTTALLITVGVGVGIGLINGVVVAVFRINPLIGTLAMLSIAGGTAYIVTGGQVVLLDPSTGGAWWGERGLFGLTNGTIAFLVLALIVGLALRFTVFGRALYAVGGNSEAAALAGMRVQTVSVSVYALSGAFAGFAGVVAAGQLLAAGPDVGTDTTLNTVAAVILGGAALTGGIGGVTGTVLGVLLLGTISNGLGLMQVASFYQTVITGVVLLLAVAFGRLREILSTNLLGSR